MTLCFLCCQAVAVSLPGTSLEGPALEQGKRSKQESFLPDLEAMLRRVEEIEVGGLLKCPWPGTWALLM